MADVAHSPSFAEVQDRWIDHPGAEGIRLRRQYYAPYFLRMGRDVAIEQGCRFFFPDRIVLEDDVKVNIGALIYGSGGVWIGRHVRIGPRCFIHSANHDVEPGGTAFFERGYIEKPVKIGSNTLISANVSILPGCQLGQNCFVACGAVVTGREYPAHSYLRGLPARSNTVPHASPPVHSPEILLITSKDAHWYDAARHLLHSLGLPQVGVIKECEDLPASAHTAILFGPSEWRPNPQVRQVWQLGNEANDRVISHNVLGQSTALPLAHKLSRVSQGSGELVQVSQALFWLKERLVHSAKELSLTELREWLVAIRLLQLRPNRGDRLLEELLEHLARRQHKFFSRHGLPIEANFDEWMSRAVEVAFRVGNAALDLKSITADPVLLVWSALNKRCEVFDLLKALQSERLQGHHLVAMGIAAALLKDVTSFKKIQELLRMPVWTVQGVAFPRAAYNGTAICYSPLVSVFRALETEFDLNMVQIPSGAADASDASSELSWPHFQNGDLVNIEGRQISRELLDNWLLIHSASCPPESRIHPQSSRTSSAPIEEAWIAIFRHIQYAVGRPLVRLRPWPSGYERAVSFRYDVDKPLSAIKITESVRIQAELVNAPCGTWHFFSEARERLLHLNQLSRHWQEIGVHFSDSTKALSGMGASAYIAPNSECWRGDVTIAKLVAQGASYCEFPVTQIQTPRPAWLCGGGGKLAQIWLTPPHFSLVEYTEENDLRYFDRLQVEFSLTLAHGGYAIVRNHLSLNNSLFIDLIRREDFSDVWFAPVGAVVKRCQAILGGDIRWFRDADGYDALYSTTDIEDLEIEVHFPNSCGPRRETLQLISGQPRRLRCTREPP